MRKKKQIIKNKHQKQASTNEHLNLFTNNFTGTDETLLRKLTQPIKIRTIKYLSFTFDIHKQQYIKNKLNK